MSSLPDRPRPALRASARLATVLARRAPEVVWRSLHPLNRERFVEAAAPPPLRRLTYRADDGWQAPVFVQPEAPGGSGEPVVLLHTLGLGPDAFRYGGAARWTDPWVRAGYRVYLPSWRGDREAEGPPRAVAGFDEVVAYDLPALLEAVRADAGARRVLLVGHGIGGQLALGHVARLGDDGLSGVAVLSAPVVFGPTSPAVSTGLSWAGRVAGAARCPTRRLARAAAAFVVSDAPDRGPRLRGALLHAAEDVPVGLLGQLATWLREGALVGHGGALDYGAALRRARVPLWVGVAAHDTWCPPEHVLPVRALWGSDDVTVGWLPDGYGHLDVIVHPEAAATVASPLVAWAARCRAAAWGAAPIALGLGPRHVRRA